mmetsp:Transcript_7497/g.28165  ORF Transcript_7497/g.28165 Transcript_7497/m.28165 type:complete len:202 (-) Transcript_7497:120-725(-)
MERVRRRRLGGAARSGGVAMPRADAVRASPRGGLDREAVGKGTAVSSQERGLQRVRDFTNSSVVVAVVRLAEREPRSRRGGFENVSRGAPFHGGVRVEAVGQNARRRGPTPHACALRRPRAEGSRQTITRVRRAHSRLEWILRESPTRRRVPGLHVKRPDHRVSLRRGRAPRVHEEHLLRDELHRVLDPHRVVGGDARCVR